MNAVQCSSSTPEDKMGETACGAKIRITPDTPFVFYRDEPVYFCEQECKQMYDHDPMSSCLAARLISGK